MNKLFLSIVLLLVTGCSPLQRITHLQFLIGKTQTQLTATDKQRLSEIGTLSAGVDYALDKTNVVIAKELNDRVGSLSDSPSVSQIQGIKSIVDNPDQITKEDKRISVIQNKIKVLNNKLTDETQKTLADAKNNAEQLTSLNKNWGLNAIEYGLKKLFTHLLITIIVLLVVYLIIRIAASSNPIASVVFSGFNQVVSYLIKGIHLVAPHAIAKSQVVK